MVFGLFEISAMDSYGDRYDPSKPIGRGSFADVFRCTLGTGEHVALKIQRDKLTTRNVSDVLLEHRTLT